MHYNRRFNTTEKSMIFYNKHVPEDFVWATNEQARLRALSLYVIRSIVQKHGGNMEIDMTTNAVEISVPEKDRAACAREIEENIGSLSG